MSVENSCKLFRDVWKGPTLLRQSTLEMDISDPIRGSACLVFHAVPFINREGVLSLQTRPQGFSLKKSRVNEVALRGEVPPERGTMYLFQASGI